MAHPLILIFSSPSLLSLQVHATKTFDLCAREATQIMGGAACIRGGPGSVVERLYREVRINAIGGGSEEILLDRHNTLIHTRARVHCNACAVL